VQDGADSELIEILDADPYAFGSSGRDTPPRAPRSRPQWSVPVAVAAIAAVALVATLAVWKPWENDFQVRLTFPSLSPVEPTLTEQLVFGDPPDDLTLASVGAGEDGFNNLAGADGYFFADANANFNLGQGGSGRWATFFAGRSDSTSQTLQNGDGALDVIVQGAPGTILTSIDSQNIELNFGPIDGRFISVVTSELTQDETLAFAEASVFDDSVPVIADAWTVAGLQPVGSISRFGSVFGFVVTAANPVNAQPTIVTAQYGPEDRRLTVTSHATGDNDLKLLSFFLGGEIDSDVHGQPALTYVADPSDSLLAFGIEFGSIVAWVEGGRMIMVTGKMPVDELIELAETVRPATDDEWAEVVSVAANTATTQ